MRWLLGLVVLAAAGVGGWLVLGHSTGGSSAVDDAAERADADPRQGPTLTGAGGSGGRGAVRAPAGRCSLECRVTREGRPAAAALLARRTGPVVRPGGARFSMADMVERLFALPPPAPAADEPGAVRGSADAAGRGLLTGLAPGTYLVTAQGADGTAGLASVALSDDGLRGLATLELQPTNLALDARVSWSDGRSPVGTLVLVPRADATYGFQMLLGWGRDGARQAAIAADGTARVEGLSPGTYDVRVVFGERFAASGPEVRLPAKSPYVLALTAPGARLTGRVLEAGGDAPVAGALVTALTAQSGRTQLIARTTADAEGRFALEASPRDGMLSAEAPGFAPAYLRNVAPTGAEVVLRLTRSARVAGRVTAADGSPAGGAVVNASARSTDGPSRTWTAVADRDGRYALEGLTPGEAQIHVRGGGWSSPGLADVRAGGFNPFVVRVPGGGALTLDLAAVRAARLEGRVLDAAGAPVPGAAVTAIASASSPFSSRGGSPSPDADTATSDSLGGFAFENLAPGASYLLTATAPDQPQARGGPFAAVAEASAPVELRFGAPRYVDVRVLFEGDERPAAGARVTAFVQGSPGAARWSPGSTPSAWVTADGDGRARVGPVGEGRITLSVTGRDLVPPRMPVPVEGSENGAGPFDVVVHVAPGLAIEGRVLKPDGTPAIGASLNTQSQRGWSEATSGAEGAFTLTGLPAGRHAITANLRAPDGKHWTGTVAADAGATGVTLALEAGVAGALETFTFRVLDDAGRPVPRANVRLVAGWSSSGTTVIEGVGTLTTDLGPTSAVGKALKEQSCFAEVGDARGADDLPLPVGTARVGPLAADQREVEVRLPAELAIEGRILTEDGQNRAGVLVSATAVPKEPRERGGGGMQRERATGRSDAQGRFRVGGLVEGEYTLSVAAAPDYVTTPGVKAAAGARDVEVKVRRGVAARIRVTDPSGKPVGNASVSASPVRPGASGSAGGVATPPPPAPMAMPDGEVMVADDGSAVFSGRGGGNATAQDGSVLLRGLDPDLSFTLHVRPPPERDDVRTFRQEGWRPGDTEVRLERGYVVAGSIRDGAGRLVAGARLLRKTGESSWSGAPTNADGTFRLTGLEPGPVTLRASGPGSAMRREGDAAPGSELTVAAGTENVVLTVDPGLTLVVKVPNLADRKGGAAQGLWAQLLRWEDGRWTQADSQWDQQGGGSVTFRGLKPDPRYAVWIAPQNDELYGWAADVKPGELTLRLERGGSIRGRVLGPSGVTQRRVWAQGDFGQSVSAEVDAEGRFELKGLPDGRWKVNAQGRVGEQRLRAEGEAAVGGTLDLTLAAPPGER